MTFCSTRPTKFKANLSVRMFMLIVLLGGEAFCLSVPVPAAQPTGHEGLPQTRLTYKAFEVDSGKTIDTSYAYITEQSTHDLFVQWFIIKDSYTHADEYLLDDRWQTKSWKVYLSDQGTDYAGVREDNRIVLKGMFQKKSLFKTIKLGEDLPFYYNPKLGLKDFALSDQKQLEFWGFRGDNLTVHKMQARKLGVQNFQLPTGSYPAVKVYWSAAGLGERFFNRVYFYRLSDGEFIGQEPSDGWTMQLIDVKNGVVTFDQQRVSID